MSQRQQPESGVFTGRVEFYREAVTGVFDENPEYMLFSDNPRNVSHTPGVNMTRRDGLGTADAVGHSVGNEQPEIEITYDLQRNLVDAMGEPLDASADGWLRNDDNRIKNTHHIRIEEEREAGDPDDPVGTTGARVFVIGQGGHPNVEMELDPEDGDPVNTIVTYMCEKVRKYSVFQPDASGLVITSSSSEDTTQTLTIENDAGDSEDVALDGSNPVATTKDDWSSIRGFELDAETDGDIDIALNDGDTTSPDKGAVLVTIRGADFYSQGDNSVEGDLGVPTLDTGSLGSPINSQYIYFNGAIVTRGGEQLPYDLNRMTATCENSYEASPRHDSTRSRWNEGNRMASLEADVIGWGASVQFHDEALGIKGDDIEITMGGTTLSFVSAVPSEPGDTERGAEDSAIEYNVVFEPSDNGGMAITQA